MKKVLAILLTLVMALSLSVTAFAEDIVIPASGSELTDSNNSYEEDLTVTYSYTAPDTTAEKVFNVTVEFTLPADMSLEYTDTQNIYTWDHTLGKYVLDETNSTEAAGELTDEGEFTITVTNRSNVPVEFDVSYTANTAAVFASKVTDWANNADVKLDTVADGQTIGETGISITDVDTATAAKTGDFASANCTGKLSVTGINTGKTPGESGTDKLGTFTVTIAEGAGEAEAEAILANVLLAKYADTMTMENPWNATADSDLNNTTAYIAFGSLNLLGGSVTINLSNDINATGSDNHYDYVMTVGTYEVTVTFITNDSGDLVGIDAHMVGPSESYVKYRPTV